MIVPLAIDPCRCPLCGQPNACAMASTQDGAAMSGPCWCTMVSFSAELLSQVPEAARQRACICAACVVASEAKPQDSRADTDPGEGA